MNRSPLRFKRTACLFYTGVMLLTSVLPMQTRAGSTPFWAALDPSLQNLLHIPMMAGFVFLFHRSLPSHVALRRGSRLLALGVAVALGIFMEGLQLGVPGRYPSWGDITLNLLGAVLGAFLLLTVPQKSSVEPKMQTWRH